MYQTKTFYYLSVLRSRHISRSSQCMSALLNGQSFTDEECAGMGGDGHSPTATGGGWPGSTHCDPRRWSGQNINLESDWFTFIHSREKKSKVMTRKTGRCIMTEALLFAAAFIVVTSPGNLGDAQERQCLPSIPWISPDCWSSVWSAPSQVLTPTTGGDTTSRVFIDSHIIAECRLFWPRIDFALSWILKVQVYSAKETLNLIYSLIEVHWTLQCFLLDF